VDNRGQNDRKQSRKRAAGPPAPEQLELPAIHETSVWKLPDLTSLPAGRASGEITDEHRATAAVIEETLSQHGVEVSVVEIKPGPSVTMFGLVPGWNRRARGGRSRGDDSQSNTITEARSRVKVDSILAREKDLALALAAPSLRLEAPVPGESVVGVEVPNKSSSIVALRKVMESDAYREIMARGGLPVALGVASAGEPVALDLLKMPHLLIAGATGSGKSVCMNSIIVSLLAHQPPSKVRMMLVDPKRVELTPYNGVPHLVTPVVTDSDKVVRLLRGAILEMGRRYKLLEEAGVRNIQSYNRSPKATEEMPYFVILIDELADLMMTASVEVEQAICRLAQLGRATGIHMVVATQRPSVDVVTGLIKANFPSRISFAVASQVDSRTILDMAGAERLLGRGDMLFLSSDAAKPRRVQGVLITDSEAELLASHWQNHPWFPLPELPLEELGREAEMASAERDAMINEGDSLYEQALNVARTQRQLSTSMLQRKLGIGYPRAAKLMDQLEEEGIVGPTTVAGKPRDVIYVPDDI
jgi:S-DNA-T family DNA segregation ATPase FtsK/SpoIIIE